ncbi:unnamed protein product [Protopolystoma xenopodis]|uniref:peptidylprolyl isomerase n=1 Tax=Protopolystoma xenopodis TaxID=117903 RepID=A0A3S5BR75_9PLAT|nr:unnamed protein product [Protopolystoma xenopodis]
MFDADTGPPRLEEDEILDETAGLSPSRVAEIKEEQEAKAHAQLLTLIGDLPAVDAKPPTNVLFICRLNPITTAEDLEIIFSRFGEILSCEIIRDRRTGASLQYAFIEFERDDDCETAYFKMDNTVIDDRRIHVDFSQSVAREWYQYKKSGLFDNSFLLQGLTHRRNPHGRQFHDYDCSSSFKDVQKECTSKPADTKVKIVEPQSEPQSESIQGEIASRQEPKNIERKSPDDGRGGEFEYLISDSEEESGGHSKSGKKSKVHKSHHEKKGEHFNIVKYLHL